MNLLNTTNQSEDGFKVYFYLKRFMDWQYLVRQPDVKTFIDCRLGYIK
jgi:hypothetical protein